MSVFGGMVRRFGVSAAGGRWPAAEIVRALEKRFPSVEPLGEELGFSLYGVSDRGVNFVIALIGEDSKTVSELAFLARFVGFPVDSGQIESINRNLHMSVAQMEGGDVYLLAGVDAAGQFREAAFLDLVESWRRDLSVVLHALSGRPSVSAAFPAARSETALRFASNAAPQSGGDVRELFQQFFAAGASARMSECRECGGRGKRGFVARRCETCDGQGFVAQER